MAQQGGTYHSPNQTHPKWSLTCNCLTIETGSPENVTEKEKIRSVHNTQLEETDKAQTDDQSWVIIEDHEAEKETGPVDTGFSSHFDLKLGWGKRKLTVFSWDIKVESTRPKREGQEQRD
ncbi:hypothetical protein F5884DRAFT_378240 [Xylogone sp. PMI_703]|nr:hypothetical protein F5884DRAFT_378240 [Xylogone sp. PMI_703]